MALSQLTNRILELEKLHVTAHIPSAYADHTSTTLAKIAEMDPSFKIGKEGRRHCKYCTYTERGPNGPVHKSVFPGKMPNKVVHACSLCRVALCIKPPTDTGRDARLSCHQRWHKQKNLVCLPVGSVPVDE